MLLLASTPSWILADTCIIPVSLPASLDDKPLFLEMAFGPRSLFGLNKERRVAQMDFTPTHP